MSDFAGVSNCPKKDFARIKKSAPLRITAPHRMRSLSRAGAIMPPRASVGETRFRSTDELLTALERKRMIPVPKAAKFKSISTDTFTRRYRHLIKQVSPGRVAVELGDVLDLPKPIDDS